MGGRKNAAGAAKARKIEYGWMIETHGATRAMDRGRIGSEADWGERIDLRNGARPRCDRRWSTHLASSGDGARRRRGAEIEPRVPEVHRLPVEPTVNDALGVARRRVRVVGGVERRGGGLNDSL